MNPSAASRPDADVDTSAARSRSTDTLADSVVLLLALMAAQRLVGFGRSVAVCRWLDPLEVGRWDMAFTFLTLAAPLAVLGLPGSFGRYIPYFQRRGQLRRYLVAASVASGLLAAGAMLLMVLSGDALSRLVFGTSDVASLLFLLVPVLAAVIVYNFSTTLFTGLRMYRVVFRLQFAHSVLFAALCVGLVMQWRSSAASILLAYGGACLVCCVALTPLARRAALAQGDAEAPIARTDLWSRVLPFAAWVWIGNLLVNLFAVSDRYLLIHFGGLEAAQAHAQIGTYHSTRVVPMLFFSLAAMLASMMTPHLSHDWEAGRRDRVALRVNLTLKLVGLGFTALAIGALLAAPLLFDRIWLGKYAGAERLLPWTLTYCIWTGLALVGQKYLWCAERARLASVALAAGLAANIGLGLLVLPWGGLPGIVLATCAANAVVLVLIYLMCGKAGMQLDGGVWLISAAPATLTLGPFVATTVLAMLVAVGLARGWLLREAEQAQLRGAAEHYLARLRSAMPQTS